MGMLIPSVFTSAAFVIILMSIAWRISHRHEPDDCLQQAARCEAQARERDVAGDAKGAQRARENAERWRRLAPREDPHNTHG